MHCDARKELLLEYALGALEGAERDELLAHLQTGCPICLGRLAEAHAILALLPLSVDAIPAPMGARRRLLEKLPSTPGLDQPLPISTPITGVRPYRHVRWIAPAALGGAVAASIACLLFINVISHERKSVDNLKYDVLQKERELIQLRASGKEGRDLQRLVESPMMQIVTLQGSAAQPGARGRLIWSPADKSFHFFAADLRNLAPGRAYELWLINNANAKIPAGVCTVSSRGEMVIDSALKVDPGVVVASAVTDEPAAGVLQPTGTIQLIGKVN